jgi:hypothetical protein
LPKPKVAVYGLTSEGYEMAKCLVDKAQVTMVDETLQMAMDVDATFLKKNPDLQAMMGEEPLLSLKPTEQVLGEAGVVVFAPKLRRPSDEALIEAGTKLRDASRSLSKGVTLVNSLPTGPGGNSENIVLIEKQTGLKIGSSLAYAYAPMRHGEKRPSIVATAGAPDGHMSSLGLAENSQNVFSAELEYASEVLSSAMASVTDIELARRAREARVSTKKQSELFLDEFAASFYDLKSLQASEGTGESVSYLAGAALKSLENYVRYVVDETREVLKERQLKASRTKITVLWTLDKYEMRGERLQVADSIQQRLRDYVTDVVVASASNVRNGAEQLDPLKHNVLITCSAADHDSVKQLTRGLRGAEITLILATPGLKRE